MSIFDSDESFSKREEFEKYIQDNIFKKESYEIIERSHNYETNNDDI